MKRSCVKITEELFYAVKMKLCVHSTYDEISKDVGVSKSTCSLIKHSATFNDYKMLAARADKHKATDQKAAQSAANVPDKDQSEKVSVVEHKQSITIQATHYMMTELQTTNELLKGISAKLAFIVEELS